MDCYINKLFFSFYYFFFFFGENPGWQGANSEVRSLRANGSVGRLVPSSRLGKAESPEGPGSWKGIRVQEGMPIAQAAGSRAAEAGLGLGLG